jgi:hypothetical protein
MMDSSPTLDGLAQEAGAAKPGQADGWEKLNEMKQPQITVPVHNPKAGKLIKKRITRPAALSDNVSRLVLSQAQTATDRYLTAGRFDRRAAGRASYGAVNVFKRTEYSEGVETAVLLLIDGSGSMDVLGKIQDARSLAYHLGMAVDEAGAKCAIASFEVASWNRVRLAMLKEFDADVEASRLACAGADGGTFLSPAIVAGAELLAGLDVQRRIILCLCDGDCDLGERAVKEACTIADTMGVEVGGIGIGGCTNCAQVFAKGVDLGYGANLSAAGLGLLIDMMEPE